VTEGGGAANGHLTKVEGENTGTGNLSMPRHPSRNAGDLQGELFVPPLASRISDLVNTHDSLSTPIKMQVQTRGLSFSTPFPNRRRTPFQIRHARDIEGQTRKLQSFPTSTIFFSSHSFVNSRLRMSKSCTMSRHAVTIASLGVTLPSVVTLRSKEGTSGCGIMYAENWT
jgi:hypothetical protein